MPTDQMTTHGAPKRPQPAHGPFLPLLLLALAVGVWFGFQTVQLLKERDNMRATGAAQEKSVQDSKRLRDSLDSVARETAQLADKGNQNAKLIVDELRKRGVTINPNPVPNPPPATGK
jgi:hypothetical protein